MFYQGPSSAQRDSARIHVHPRVLSGPSRDRPGTLGGPICDLRISNLEDPRTAPGRVLEPSQEGFQDCPRKGPRTVPEFCQRVRDRPGRGSGTVPQFPGPSRDPCQNPSRTVPRLPENWGGVLKLPI